MIITAEPINLKFKSYFFIFKKIVTLNFITILFNNKTYQLKQQIKIQLIK